MKFPTNELLQLMKNVNNIRNAGFAGHIDHGKTSTSDCLLAYCGVIVPFLAGQVRYLDYLDMEQKRGITIKTAAITLLAELPEGVRYVLNFIDTPGHVDFSGKVSRALRLMDGVIIVVDAVEGIMAQTEAYLRLALEEHVKPILYINKIDRLITELSLTPHQIRARLEEIIVNFNDLIEAFGVDYQVKEWQDLGIVDDSFNKNKIIENDLTGKNLNKGYKYLPIDTKYFKDLELDILGLFDDLDNSLDGWLIKSENYQALNTILPKFKEKVQTIYIDPPFNKEQDADYFYSVKYKDSSWITLLENRLLIAKDVLNPKGSIFVRCDYNGNMYVRLLMNEIFGEENFRNELIVKRGKIQFGESSKYTVATDSLFWYSKTYDYHFEKFKRPRYKHEPKGSNMVLRGERFPRERTFYDEKNRPHKMLPPDNMHFKFIQPIIDEMSKKGLITLRKSKKGLESGYMELIKGKWEKTDLVPYYVFDIDKAIDTNWTDISGYSQDWGFETENSEKLLRRVIETSSKNGEIIVDFFLGSGTTTAVAHKLKRKWIGVEMGEHFHTVILPRMKKVLSGDKSGISKQIKWRGGGFFKYYSLEQFEDTLLNSNYKPKNNDFANIEFKFCDKLLDKCLDIDYKNQKATYNFCNLYPNIDVAESISNILGKKIKKIQKNKIILDNGDKGFEIDLTNLDNEKYNFLKKLIWWQE